MVGAEINEALGLAFDNVTLLALLVALSTLLLGYIQCELAGRRLSTDFSLRKLESMELARSLLLYRKASDRLREIYLESTRLDGADRRDRRRRRIEFRERHASEFQDLSDYARDLRSTIIRIRGRPLQRYKSWAQVMSLQVGFRRSINAYFLTAVTLSVLFSRSQGEAHARSVKDAIDAFTQWKLFDGALNASGLLIVAAIGVLPIFYLRHRLKLRKLHAVQIRLLQDLASADTDKVHRSPAGGAADQGSTTSLEFSDEPSCFNVLGLSPSATVEDVKNAYKVLVKQTHPDRVQDMSLMIRKMAESETKKLNVAYAEALVQLEELEE